MTEYDGDPCGRCGDVTDHGRNKPSAPHGHCAYCKSPLGDPKDKDVRIWACPRGLHQFCSLSCRKTDECKVEISAAVPVRCSHCGHEVMLSAGFDAACPNCMQQLKDKHARLRAALELIATGSKCQIPGVCCEGQMCMVCIATNAIKADGPEPQPPLMKLLEEAIALAEEGWSYAMKYLKKKHKVDARLNKLKGHLPNKDHTL